MSRDSEGWDWDDPDVFEPETLHPPPKGRRPYKATAQKIADFYASRTPDYQQYNRSVRGLEMDGGAPARRTEGSDLPPPPRTPLGKWAPPSTEMYNPSQAAPMEAKVLFPPPGAGVEGQPDEQADPDIVDVKAVKDMLGMVDDEQDAASDISMQPAQAPPAPPQPVFPSLSRPKVKSIFALQVASTLALVAIFVINCYLNARFYETLAEFDEILMAISNPILLGIFGTVVSFVLLLFFQFNSKIRRRITLVVCFSIIGILVLPPMVAIFQGGWMVALWQLISVGLILLKVILLFLLWSPLILGVFGVWLRNRTSLFMSAVLMLSVVIILDVILLVLSETPQKELWGASLMAFAIGLFLFFELGESAIRFEQLYHASVLVDKKTVQSRHIIRLSKRYFIFTVVFLFVALFCTLLIYNSDVLFIKFMPEKTSKSLIMDTVYGSLFSMALMIMLLVVAGSTLKNWTELKGWWAAKARSMAGSAGAFMRERERKKEEDEAALRPEPARHAIKKRPARHGRGSGAGGKGGRRGRERHTLDDGPRMRGTYSQGGQALDMPRKRPRHHRRQD